MKILLSLILLLAAPALAQTTAPATQPTDALFDATNYTGKPDLSAQGWRGVHLVHWRDATNADGTEPDEAKVRAQARLAVSKRQLCVINIEHWPVDVRSDSLAVVKDSIRKLRLVADWAHDEEPGLAVGVYRLMPLRDYWTPVQYELLLRNAGHPWFERNRAQFTKAYRDWLGANTRLRTLGLAEAFDFVCPSLYIFRDDPESNAIYFRHNLSEAEKFGKRIYPFLWLNYHDTNQLAQAESWPPLLPIVRENSDGIMLWSGAVPWTDEVARRVDVLSLPAGEAR